MSSYASDFFIELPYTLPQDFTLFILMREKTIKVWKEKLDWIAEKGGMALLNTHPDYMNFDDRKCSGAEYPASYYEEFLQYVKNTYQDLYWHVLPREMACFCSDWCKQRPKKAHAQNKVATVTAGGADRSPYEEWRRFKLFNKEMRKRNHKSRIVGRKVWIDLDNSPHVPFFNPIIKELEKRGYQTTVTARDCFQVCGLADLFELQYRSIGRHYGKNVFLKIIGTVIRSLQLFPFAVKLRRAIAVSHGSRAQLLTASLLRIPTVSLFDYEYTKGVGITEPDWVIGPEVIPDSAIPEPPDRILRYPGLKEDVYVPEFQPDPGILSQLGINNGELLVTIRPPATEAHYHNPESEKFFIEVVNLLGSNPDVRMVILPRNNRKQTEWIEKTWRDWCRKGKILIPKHVVNGLNLIWHSALVVSGGGTMNREAAALGVPVYSIFQGKIGAVDQYLAQAGRLVLLQRLEDIPNKIDVTFRHYPKSHRKLDNTTCNKIVEYLEGILNNSMAAN
jgi:hypothetical protein